MERLLTIHSTAVRTMPVPYVAGLPARFDKAEPECVTILPTYRCNAACRECCFESDPSIKHRMTRRDILGLIQRIRAELPRVRYIVFSGGEVTLLRNDLIDAIALATQLGLGTRVVSNGHWGRSDASAREWIGKFIGAGLCELNLSTGDEHLEWVPLEHVARAAFYATQQKLLTLMVVEGSQQAKFRADQLQQQPLVQEILRDDETRPWLILMTNVWMPFHQDANIIPGSAPTHEGCDNIFENFVINPHGYLMSCCGLTMEYIPELKVGNALADHLHSTYVDQFGDLLKLWIWLDGTQAIFEAATERIGQRVDTASPHPCAVCAQIYQTPLLRNTVVEMAQEKATDIVFRAAIKARMRGRMDVRST